jgi:probable HAF family extracellular repeat protein
MNRKSTRVVLLLATLCLSTGSAFSAPKYDIIDLGVPPGGTSAVPNAINNKGDVVGYFTELNDRHAFIWSGGVMTELPGFGGQPNTHAWDINDNGLVVGQSSGDGVHSYSLLWENGIVSSIGNLGSNNNGANYARTINNGGDIAGQSAVADGYTNTVSAYLKPAGQPMQAFGPVGRILCIASDINNSGKVVGTIINLDATNSYRAFVYDGGSVANLGLPNGAVWSSASGINDSGDIVGWGTFYYGSTPLTRAMLYKDGIWIDLNAGAPTACLAINHNGDIVGYIGLNPQTAVVWKNRQMQTLISLIDISSGWSRLDIPNDINNSGQIVGVGIHNGVTSAFLMSPHKFKLKIFDAYRDSLPGKTVSITRISTNTPLYTERVVRDFVIDPSGVVEFSSDSISSGERFKVTLDVAEVPAIKHTDITTNKYHVFLDNVMFDSLGFPKFDTLVFAFDTQEVFIDHTTFVYDFVVSIEWDADLSLIADVESSFRNMANYMYDVTDGQARIGNIYLYDLAEQWGEADVHLWADNMMWPHVANVGGIDRAGGSGDPVEMPRKWFGDSASSRNGTWTEWPLQMNVSLMYTTLLHELGHYAFAFMDEYRRNPGAVLCADRPHHVIPYGFMDCQYDICGDYSSEMSSESAYANTACRNNFQWNLYHKSCWSVFEKNMEHAYGANSIGVVVTMPDERVLPDGKDFLPGPNDSLSRLDCDVGALVQFPVNHIDPVRGNIIVSCWDVAGDSVPGAVVTLNQASGGVNKQGKTSDWGGIRVLNYLDGDEIETNARRVTVGSIAASSAITNKWLFGIMDPAGQSSKYRPGHSLSSDGDSVAIIMNEVFGNYPMVFSPTYNNGELSFTAWTPATFSQIPTIEHQPDGLPSLLLTVGVVNHGYSAMLPLPAATGTLRIDALDDSAHAFFVPVSYGHYLVDSTVSRVATMSSNGAVEVDIDSAVSGISSITIVSSAYPVMTDGLEPSARQAGEAHGVAFGGVESVSGSITIRYSSSDVESSEQELTLRVHQFDDSAMRWVVIGGSVDTTHNEVVSGISEPGVYALFMTIVPTGIDDPPGQESLPQRFELRQNYPNPFNPVTTIEYSIPSRALVTIEIFNMLGQRVRTMVNETKSVGSYRTEWNGLDDTGKPVSTGVYLYRFQAGDVVQTKKMLLLK